MPVAMQLVKVCECVGNVIQGVGALGVTRHLRNLPGGQLAVQLLGQHIAFAFQAANFF